MLFDFMGPEFPKKKSLEGKKNFLERKAPKTQVNYWKLCSSYILKCHISADQLMYMN